MRVSIGDVAARAGVSNTTVSHALNGKGRITSATRERVLKAASELGYVANPNAAGLRTGQSSLFAIQISPTGGSSLVPNSSYFTELLNGASAEALKSGHPLVVLPRELSVSELDALGISRAIIVDPIGDEPLVQHLLSTGGTLVTTGRLPDRMLEQPTGRLASIDNDARAVTRTALDHLQSAGYRHPAVLTSPTSVSFFRDCVEEARAWAAENGRDVSVAHISNENEPAARRAVARLLDGDPAVDALFTTSEAGAIGAVAVVRHLGRHVAEEFGIVAGNDTALLRYSSPSISAIDLHPDQIGRAAVRKLLEFGRAASDGGDAEPTVIGHSQRRRESTRRRR